MRKKPDPAIISVQSKMFANGIRISDACARASISPASWSRWAAGGTPDLTKLRSLEAAVDEMTSEDGPA